MLRDDETRVHHAVDAARKAIHFARDAERGDLEKDEKLAFTLIHLLEIVGEACNQVSEEFQKTHPGVPWEKVIALRHRLAHGYFDVNLDIVWETVRVRLPALVLQLEKTLER